ncbi:hypothetical protein [Bradyrhizobium sp. P5_C11_2]
MKRITFYIRGDRRVLLARSEREAALMAESVIRRYDDPPGRVGFIIDASDAQASARIAAYLDDAAQEMELA